MWWLVKNELDELVAEKVMGFKKIDLSVSERPWQEGFGVITWRWDFRDLCGPWQLLQFTQPYSTNIADAWDVVEKLRERGILIQLTTQPKYFGVEATVYRDGRYYPLALERADSAPLAICLAGLKAVGHS